NHCEVNYRTNKNQRLQVELALLKICPVASAIQLAKDGVSLPQTSTGEKKKSTLAPSPADRRLPDQQGSPAAAANQPSSTAGQAPSAAAHPSPSPKDAGSEPAVSSPQSSVTGQRPAAVDKPSPGTPPPKARAWGDV